MMRVSQEKPAKLSSLPLLGLILITIFIKGLDDGIKHIQCGFDLKPGGAESNLKGKV